MGARVVLQADRWRRHCGGEQKVDIEWTVFLVCRVVGKTNIELSKIAGNCNLTSFLSLMCGGLRYNIITQWEILTAPPPSMAWDRRAIQRIGFAVSKSCCFKRFHRAVCSSDRLARVLSEATQFHHGLRWGNIYSCYFSATSLPLSSTMEDIVDAYSYLWEVGWGTLIHSTEQPKSR